MRPPAYYNYNFNTVMETVKLFASTSKVMVKKSTKTDKEQGAPAARSLSRTTTQAAARLRLEESRTFIGTPRGSAGEVFTSGKLSSVQSKPKVSKKEKPSLEKGQKPKKKEKKKKEGIKKDKDGKSREKEARSLADRLHDIKFGAAPQKKTVARQKGDKKATAIKDSHPKMLLKKRLTLEEEDFCYNFGSEQKSTKNYPGSPKDDAIIQNQLVIQRLKKCLDSRPLRQINDSKMKKSFKGDLVSKIKSQADKLARKASKELEHGSSPAVDDLMLESHRELANRTKRGKEPCTENLIDRLKTELSISTDKRSTNNQSPVKVAKDWTRPNQRDISGKHSPQPRLARSRKMPPQTTSKKENNRSQEKKPRGTADAQVLRFSQNFKQTKQKQTKPTDYLSDHAKDPREEREKKQKGINFFHTLSNFRSSEICKFRLAARAISEAHRPEPMQGVIKDSPFVASISEDAQKCLELRLASSTYLTKSLIQERTDKEFESRPDFPDRSHPIPMVEMGDLGTALYRPEVRLSLAKAETNSQTSRLYGLDQADAKVKRNSGAKCKPKTRIEDCMEDIPNLPLETSTGTPVMENLPKPRVRPLIINRGAAGIYSTSTFY